MTNASRLDNLPRRTRNRPRREGGRLRREPNLRGELLILKPAGPTRT